MSPFFCRQELGRACREGAEQRRGERSALVPWAVVLQMPLGHELLGLHVELGKVLP